MNRSTATALFLSTCLLTGGALAQTPPSDTKFVTSQTTGEFKASKFVGLNVYNTEGEKVGDISEILLDTQGNAKAVVIGVGGFLGIGQKNVAVPWSAVAWANEPPTGRSAATGTTAPPASPSTMTGGQLATTPPSRNAAEQAAYNGYPDHATIKLSKAELKDAPAFKYVSDTAPSGAGKAPTEKQ